LYKPTNFNGLSFAVWLVGQSYAGQKNASVTNMTVIVNIIFWVFKIYKSMNYWHLIQLKNNIGFGYVDATR
jgi:hypothetical protein